MSSPDLNEILKISKNLGSQLKSETDDFYSKYVETSKDELSLVLKSHLYLELTVDKMLHLLIPNPDKILQMRFSDKVSILESLNFILEDEDTLNKIRGVNIIRNRFSHQLNFTLNKADLKKAFKVGGEISQSPRDFFLEQIGYIHGSIGTLINILLIFPFYMSVLRNKTKFSEDPIFNIKEIQGHAEKYGFKESVETIIDSLR